MENRQRGRSQERDYGSKKKHQSSDRPSAIVDTRHWAGGVGQQILLRATMEVEYSHREISYISGKLHEGAESPEAFFKSLYGFQGTITSQVFST